MTSLMTKKPNSAPATSQNGSKHADKPVDHARIEAAVREILFAVGEDPDREGLLETPARVARMYARCSRA